MERIQKLVETATEEATRDAKRKAEEISDMAEKTSALRAKLQRLEASFRAKQKEHLQQNLISELQEKGTPAWERLSTENQYKKSVLLALLSTRNTTTGPPDQLKEEAWKETSFADKVRTDPDIVLARLTSPLLKDDFTKHYLRNDPRPNISYPTFTLPPGFQIDKDLVIAAVDRYPEILKQDVLPEHMLDSRDVFLAFCQSDRHKYPHRVGKGCLADSLPGLLSKFSTRLRGTRRLMVMAAQCFDPHVVVNNLAGELLKDIGFAQTILELYKEDECPTQDFLLKFSPLVRSDKALVRGLVKKNGRCLQHAGFLLRRDKEIIQIACANDASAVLFASNCEVFKSKIFMLDVFARWPKAQAEPKLYKKLCHALKVDKDIIVEAHAARCVSFSDVPKRCMEDRNFCLALVKRDATIWSELGERFRQDVNFARALENFPRPSLAWTVLESFPTLREEESIWSKIVSSAMEYDDFYDDLVVLFRTHAPRHVLENKTLMAQACDVDYEILALLGQELLHDRSFLEIIIDTSGYSLRFIPDSAQIQNPDLVCHALRDIAESEFGELDQTDPTLVAEELWTQPNLDVAREWFAYGGEVHSLFPEAVKGDENFALLVAETSIDEPAHYYETELLECHHFKRGTSEVLRENKAFMMRAVDINPWLFLSAGPKLSRDVDLAYVAFGKVRSGSIRRAWLDLYDDAENDFKEVLAFLTTVYRTAKDKVEAFDGFTKGLLPGLLPRNGTNCALSMLAIGEEGSGSVFGKKIASILGVPPGPEIPKLRTVVKNLDNLPDPPCSCSACGSNCRIDRQKNDYLW